MDTSKVKKNIDVEVCQSQSLQNYTAIGA